MDWYNEPYYKERMIIMSCPYYKFESSLFGGDYYCTKQQKEVNSDTYYKYCRNYDYSDCPIYKGNDSSSGCFLTSACTAARGLPDDCRELQILRAYRDNWLKHQPDGILLIAKYYEIAPKIVAAIDARADRLEIFDKLYTDLVLPCVEMIDAGSNEDALKLYQETTLKLEKAFC